MYKETLKITIIIIRRTKCNFLLRLGFEVSFRATGNMKFPAQSQTTIRIGFPCFFSLSHRLDRFCPSFFFLFFPPTSNNSRRRAQKKTSDSWKSLDGGQRSKIKRSTSVSIFSAL